MRYLATPILTLRTAEVDGVSDAPGKHFYKSLIIGPDPGPFIPFPSHSTLSRIGPKEWILMLDCRCEA